MDAIVADRIDALNDLPRLPAGTHVVYHIGLLGSDRSDIGRNGKRKSKEDLMAARDVNKVGDLAWELYERGSVILTQRRIGAELFEYIAIRKRVFGRA